MGDAVQLGPHGDGHGPGVVDLAEVDGLRRGMRGEHGEALGLQGRNRVLDTTMVRHPHPLLRPGRRAVVEIQIAAFGDDHVRLQDPGRVAVPQDRREVVRLVHAVHEHRQVGLAAGQDGSEAVEALGSHGAQKLAPPTREREP